METIIFATKNKGKIKEINEILADMNVNVISMEEAGITIDVVEDGKTFEENAMKKAVQVMEIGGKITLSDDSGLEIDYMDKAPGIYSARFMGEDTPYPERFKAIFEKLNGVPEEKRTARFVSCIAAASLMADVWSAMIPLRASSAMRQRARMASAMTLFFMYRKRENIWRSFLPRRKTQSATEERHCAK